MNPTLLLTAEYLTRLAPALVLLAAMLFLARRDAPLRIVIYIAGFVLLRDAMTPLRLWSFGREGLFWIRLHHDPWLLLAFGTSCAAMSFAVYLLDRENRNLFRWTRGNTASGLLWGVGGACLVVAPLVFAYQFTPLETRGGYVPRSLLPALLFFGLAGNLLEEAIFRGYVLGRLLLTRSPLAAGAASGIVFAFCHIFLATTVTNVGYPLLAFTLWEGVIAGMVGAKYGVAFSTITHGGAIFLLASGLF
jgi:membrane protease YdiL (CAAX protease family)